MNKITFKNKIDLYNFEYKVVFDIDSYFSELKRNDLNDDDNEINFDGCVFRNEEKDFYLIYVKCNNKSVSINTLSHECFHLIDFLGERVGLEYTNGTGNEHFAYLIGYISEQILDNLEYYNKIGLKK